MRLLAGSIILVYFVLMHCGCTKDNHAKKEIPDSYFTIDTDIKDFNGGHYPTTVFELDAGVELFHHYYYLGRDKENYCWRIHFFYPPNRSNYMLMVRPFDGGKFKAFFIRWENGPSGYKMFEPEFTIYTNLEKNQIKELYPFHKGNVIKESIKDIDINKHFYDLCWDIIWRFNAVKIVESVGVADEND